MLRHGGVGLHLDADHLDGRRMVRRRDRAARDQSSATHRRQDAVERRLILQHLDRHRALPRDHGRIVVGMDKDEIFVRGQLPGKGGGFRQNLALEPNPRPEFPRPRHLHERRRFRHHDRGGDAEVVGVISHALGVVAGGHGDDAALRLLR